MSTGRLAGKVAAVTGAASGIGLASARAFAAEGAGVACLDLDGAAAEVAAAGIVEAGGRAIAVACDVRDGEQVEAAMTQTAVRLGPPSVAMCNAAAFTPSHRIVDLAEADWQQALAVNLTGVFLSCKHAIPHMLAAGGGSII
ncbi:MAG: SDR family NAD(P)-dependent oxidoreductase, partial [Alphaproteobacteria bacterium]|nr:SDR family NAD(P)-dependent oxidoreductase [Alphaproteobacteria bacterium]